MTHAFRLRDKPVVAFGAVDGYGPIFNAGVIHVDSVFHLFARGVRDSYRRNSGPGAPFLDYVSDVLVFTSRDGLEYRFQQVLAKGSPDGVYCLEDPRVQRVRSGSDSHYVMSYTRLPSPDSGLPWRIGVHRLVHEEGRFALNRTSGRLIGPEHTPNKDAVLFNLRDGSVALIHRIHPDMQLAVFGSLKELYDADEAFWGAYLRELDAFTLIKPCEGSLSVGAGAPPVPTEDGLLLFYHEHNSRPEYTINAAILDADDGTLKALLPEPILRPELPWEREGDVDDVVFVQGAVWQPNGHIYLTYGAADRCVGVAVVDEAELLSALRRAA